MTLKDAGQGCSDSSSVHVAGLSGSGSADVLPSQASASDAVEAQQDAGQAPQDAVLLRLECMTARELKVGRRLHLLRCRLRYCEAEQACGAADHSAGDEHPGLAGHRGSGGPDRLEFHAEGAAGCSGFLSAVICKSFKGVSKAGDLPLGMQAFLLMRTDACFACMPPW